MYNRIGAAKVWLLSLLGVALLSGAAYFWYVKVTSEPEPPVVTETRPGPPIEPVPAPVPEDPGRLLPPPEGEIITPIPSDQKEEKRTEKLPPAPPGTGPIHREAIVKPDTPPDSGRVGLGETEPDVPDPTLLDTGIPGDLSSKNQRCLHFNQHLLDFLEYLNAKAYIRDLDLQEDVTEAFRRMLRRLEKNPPVPAGEGIEPSIMTRNIFFLYRSLTWKDIGLIKEILQKEQDTLELNLSVLYPWLMLGKDCPGIGIEGPSFETSYLYAGFFLNTIGGRSYLFRRTPLVRLLVNYYAIRIVHEADVQGKNSYGINLVPFIQTNRQEMEGHSSLHFQRQYLKELERMEAFYRDKR